MKNKNYFKNFKYCTFYKEIGKKHLWNVDKNINFDLNKLYKKGVLNFFVQHQVQYKCKLFVLLLHLKYDLPKNVIQRTFNKKLCPSFAIFRNILKNFCYKQARLTERISVHLIVPIYRSQIVCEMMVKKRTKKKSRMTNDQRTTCNGRATDPRRVPFY